MTTTTSVILTVPDSPGVLDAKAVSEAARSATLAQNRAAAMRLEAAHLLVEEMARLDREDDGNGSAAAGGPRRRPAVARLAPEARARDHLAAACQLTCWHAARLVTAGVQIHRRLTRLRSTVDRGLMPEQLAVEIACRLAEVPDAIVSDVEDEVMARIADDLAGGDIPSRTAVGSLLDEAVERHDPAAAEDACAAAAETRSVRFRPSRNGMATMWAKLPVSDAELLRRRIETDATAASEDGLDRTMDQLRADALAALAVYAPAGQTSAPAGQTSAPVHTEGAGGGDDGIELGDVALGADLPRPTLGNAAAAAGQPIRISVISAVSQGLPNRVEFVRGAYSSFDWLCQELLEGDDATVRFQVVDPAPGALDSPDHALRYRISPAMAERIRLRDGTCRHPGCSVAARDCDVDHLIAFNKTDPELGGPTLEWNLYCLCRKHHREKTFGRSEYRPGPLGELIIVTETGHEHRTRPRGPLARARDDIREREWSAYTDRVISADGMIISPPGSDRRHYRTPRGRSA